MTLNQQRKMKIIFIRYMKISMSKSDMQLFKDHLINILLKQTIDKNDFNIFAEFTPYFISEISEQLQVPISNLKEAFDYNIVYELDVYVSILEKRYSNINKSLKIWNKP